MGWLDEFYSVGGEILRSSYMILKNISFYVLLNHCNIYD